MRLIEDKMGREIGRVIAECAPEIGAHTATSCVSATYVGPCAVLEAGQIDKVVAVLPSPEEAFALARYAISPSGGYGSVIIEETDRQVTHTTYTEWAFG